ncbi:protein adenylyltransferase SelO [Aliiruegeria sabulilitoris]|uniref:protein adenylyltransferase SelO n=1 Tax=Aliiruegeria sabulilitoris TaxID=1510458 RepID=UPI0008353061|nr:YdiU family protein [Aliiruegeria sabulilitoris]NDR56468.1 YdiU family protein [Pseudoruegeria sp. M32A2M]
MTIQIPFDNSYARLPGRFFMRQAPVPVKAPELLLLNLGLVEELGLDAEALQSAQGVAFLSGNGVPEGAEPLAQAYAGHQFGGFSPVLGDGRAILLGEVIDRNGARRDIQLKGSGLTAFSRPGSDGRAPLGAVIREFILSEAMHALGIPTTRSLAVTATGEHVRREAYLPGGVLTRVAASHIRVGTFQFFAARQDTEALAALLDHAIERHFPQADGPLAFLDAVIASQARLVCQWLGIGFIHGVMNTDNTAISGETIDFGPCAMMDTFHPATVYSSIDHGGRYAYGRQAEILGWNLAQLASALLPLVDADQDAALEAAQAAMERYPDLLRENWSATFRAKIGLVTEEPEDDALVAGLLQRMAEEQADFTNTFRALATGAARDQFTDPTAFDQWEADWRARLAREPEPEALEARLKQVNPAIIARNHRVEQAIAAALDGDLAPTTRLVAALSRPFDDLPGDLADLARPPLEEERVHRTFCGT